MPFEPQDIFQARQLVVSHNKQTTYGTALGGAALIHKAQFDGGAFARFAKEFRTNLERAGKGHPWATERQEIARMTGFDFSGELSDFLAGYLCMFLFNKVLTSGAGPYTHVFTFENATNQAIVTTMYFQDTADLKVSMPDLSCTDLEFSGSDKGPIAFSSSWVGSGRFTAGAVGAADALSPATNVYLLGSDTDIKIGAQGASASIKERVRQWSLRLSSPTTPHRAPGGGMYATMNKLGPQRVSLTLAIAAKDVDDIKTLLVNDTIQEVKIETTSSAKQFNILLPGLYVADAQLVADGNEEVWQLSFDEGSIIKSGANEVAQITVINSQATYGVAA